VRVLGAGELVDVDRPPRGPGQPAVAGDVIGVVVGLEHVLDPDAVQPAQPQVRLDRPLGVDHGGDARASVTDEVGGAAQVLVQDLAEEHSRQLRSRYSPVKLGWRFSTKAMTPSMKSLLCPCAR
jgi:hypothetical protein